MNLTTARDYVRTSILFDDGTQWSDGEIDQAIHMAIQTCCSEYSSSGGDMLRATMSTTVPEAGLTLPDDFGHVRRIDIWQGGTRFEIPHRHIDASSIPVQSSAVLYYTRIPTDPGPLDELLPVRFTELESWILFNAALTAKAKDNEQSPQLRFLEDRARRSCLKRRNKSMVRKAKGEDPFAWGSKFYGYDIEGNVLKIHRSNVGW